MSARVKVALEWLKVKGILDSQHKPWELSSMSAVLLKTAD